MQTKTKITLCFCILLFSIVSFANRAQAAAFTTWTGNGTTNNWSDAGNWSAGVPGAGVAATFDSTSTKDSVWDAAGPASIVGLTVNASYSGTLTMGRNVTVTNNWTYNGANFNAGTYEVYLNGGGGTHTFGSVNYYDVKINRSGYANFSGTATILHNLTFATSYGMTGGTFNVAGDVSMSIANDWGGTCVINLNGAGDQTLSNPQGIFPSVTVNKTSGSVIFNGTISAYNWTWTSGTLNAGTNKLKMHYSTFVPGNANYYDLEVVGDGYLSVTGTANILHDLYCTGPWGTQGGTLNVGHDVIKSAAASGDLDTSIVLNGTGDQSINTSGGSLGQVTINKSSGTLNMSGTISVRSWAYTKGNINAGTSTLTISSISSNFFSPGNVKYYNVEINKSSSAQTVTLQSNLYVTNNFTLTQGDFRTSASNYTLYAKNFIQNANTTFYAYASSIIITGDFTKIGGTFTQGTSTVSFQGTNQSLNVGGTAVTFYNLYKLTNTTDTFTINSGANITIAASGTMRLWGKPEGNTLNIVAGTAGTGYNITKTGNWEAEYVNISDMKVTSSVTASASSIGTGTSNVVVTKEFISTIRSSGGDYTTLSAWEAAVNVDLTAATTKVFSFSTKVGTIPDNSWVRGSSSGAKGIAVHVSTDNQILIKSITGTFQNSEPVMICADGASCTISDAGNLVVLSDVGYGAIASAYPYNDWAGGLDDLVDFSGWTTDATHFVNIYVPLSQRHKGTLNSGGFFMKSTSNSNTSNIFIVDSYTRVEGLKIERTSTNWSYGAAVYIGNGANTAGKESNNQIKDNIFYQSSGGTNAALVYNVCSASEGYGNKIFNNILISSSSNLVSGISIRHTYLTSARRSSVYNNVVLGQYSTGAISIDNQYTSDAYKTNVNNNYAYNSGAGADYVFLNDYNSSLSNFANNASDDGTAGTANYNKTIALANAQFKNTSSGSEDLHINDSSQLKNKGLDLSTDPNFPVIDDIDGQSRLALDPNAWSIGADQYSATTAEMLGGTADTSAAPVAYWSFNEGQGMIAHDETSNKNDGNLSVTGGGPTTPTWKNDCARGKCLYFDGNSWVETDKNFGITAYPFSFSVWFKAQGSGFRNIISLENKDADIPYYRLLIDSSNHLNAGARYDSSPETVATYNADITNGWHHAVGVFSSATDRKLYVDGALQASDTASMAFATVNRFSVGRLGRSSDTNYFTGYIDEPRVYNYALTADQIKREYNGGQAMQLGSSGSVSGTGAPTNSASGDYCVPGDTTSCAAPVGEWKMDEGSGTTAYDTSGNANNASLGTGLSAPTWTSGKFGNGLSFNGVSSYAYVNDTSNLRITGDLTLSVWVKINNNGNYSSIISKGDSGPYEIGADFRSGASKLSWRSTNSGFNTNWDNFFLGYTGQWVNIQIVVSGTNATAYRNGVSMGTIAIGSRSDPRFNLEFGVRPGSPLQYFISGIIDQVRIYNYARTPAQIAYEYNQGAPVAWWSMNECTGTAIHDETANRNDGTLNLGSNGQTSAGDCQTNANTAWYNGRTGKYGGGLNFDGTDDYIQFGTAPYFNSNNSFTLSAWVYSPSYRLGAAGIIGTASEASPWDGIWFQLNAGKPTFVLQSAAGVSSRLDATASLSTSTWHHVVATYDGSGSSDGMNLYVDGTVPALTKSRMVLGTIPQHNWVIGADSNHTADFFVGQIDEVKIFNYGLTAEQVKNLYNNSAAISFGN